MKNLTKAAIAAASLAVPLAISGYASHYLLHRAKSADISDLKYYENLTLSAKVMDKNGYATTLLTDNNKFTGITVVNGDCIYLKFKKPVFCNTILLEEALNKQGTTTFPLEGGTKRFSIYAALDGDEKLIYSNDKIDEYRMCTFPRVQTDYLRIQFDECRGNAKINKIAVYDVGKAKQDFRVNNYFVYNKTNYEHNEKFKSLLNGLTDLTMFIGVSVDNNCNVVYEKGKDAFAERLADVRRAIGDRDIKLYTTVFCDFKNLLYGNTKKIAKALAEFVQEFNLDGVDFDWEYPQGSKEWQAYSDLAIDVHNEFSKIGKKVSFAIAVFNIHFSREAMQALDYLNIMVYDQIHEDYDGYHATFKHATLAIEKLIYKGYKREKLCLGLAFYGRNLKHNNRGNYWLDYSNSNINDPWTNFSDKAIHIDDKTKQKSVRKGYFNSYAMIRDKTAYAISTGIGGIMNWEIMSDLPASNPLSLHNAVNEVCAERLKKTNKTK